MSRLGLVLFLLALAGCDQIDPYQRAGTWRPSGANDSNLRAMVVVPSDLAVATHASHADGGLAAAALTRLRNDKVRPMPDSGLAQIVPVSGGTAPAAAAPSPGGSQ